MSEPTPPTARDVLGTPLPPVPVVNAVMRARGRFRRRSTKGLPPQVVVVEHSLGVLDTVALRTLVELGVAAALGRRAVDGDELAATLDCDRDALDRLLRYSAARGFVRRDRRGRVAANRVTEVLREDHPTSLAAWVTAFGAPWFLELLSGATEAVRTGRSSTAHVTGEEFFDLVHGSRPEVGADFDAAMADGARLLGLLLAESVDWSTTRTVCDVGGGTGRHLADLLARNPRLRGVLLDLPVVAGRARSLLEGAGVAGRVEVHGGDFFVEVPGGCDRYLLTAVVHDWDDAGAARILSNVRRVLPPGGEVLVVENRLHDDDVWELAKAADLMMLLLTGSGRERTRQDMAALAERAGLRAVRATPLANGFEVTWMAAA